MSQSSYRNRMRRATAIAFGVPTVIGAALGLLLRAVSPGEHFWLVFLALLAGCVLAFWACIPWWRRMDDMQKEGHLVSWYWGGIGGGIAVLMAIIAGYGLRSDQATGVLMVLTGQVAGFLLFWLFWARGRRGSQA
jgi:uncharacterized membrane protein YfcA